MLNAPSTPQQKAAEFRALAAFMKERVDGDRNRFTMATWYHATEQPDCRTTACIAGWQCTRIQRFNIKPPSYFHHHGASRYAETARLSLGLTPEEAAVLFEMDNVDGWDWTETNTYKPYEAISVTLAVYALEEAARHAEQDKPITPDVWNKAIEAWKNG